MIGAIGVVYGDIGTSPLYAMRESLRTARQSGLEDTEVVGIVSLLLWTLTIIVTLKYVVLMLQVDSRRSFRASPRVGMPLRQDHLYITIASFATDASGFFGLPTNRVLEVGRQFVVQGGRPARPNGRGAHPMTARRPPGPMQGAPILDAEQWQCTISPCRTLSVPPRGGHCR